LLAALSLHGKPQLAEYAEITLEQKTIIIVEDEPDTAEMFAEMLRLNGYRVLSSYGGAAAIGLISKEKVDAVVLDLMMPDLSGLEVLSYMRRDPRLSRVPVMIVSAKGLPADVRQGLQAGASIYLTKPVAYQDFIDALEKALQID
jgi:two-component system sensor histidine kinase ChiS